MDQYESLKTEENVCRQISALLDYAEEKKLIRKSDRVYCANLLCDDMRQSNFAPVPAGNGERPELHEILSALCGAAVERGIIPAGTAASDRFDTKLMGRLTPFPSDVIRRFRKLHKKDPQAASDYYYRLARDTNYIRTDRVSKDLKWSVGSVYGDIDISINLSKPEKDPRDIAAAKNAPQTDYPLCLLCHENEGFAGDPLRPARQTLRQIPFRLGGERWYMQYSPYVYYNEHCIVLSSAHSPMSITRKTFVRMFDFITEMPHYFIGSNADLPIVGGSILSHDHMQGGRYVFPMERAGIDVTFDMPGYPGITAGTVSWPMSVIRLRSASPDSLVDAADRLLACWRVYSDPEAGIFCETDGVPHNTVTPIARRRGTNYEIDLVLRNNITSAGHPMGVFHPHADKHNIKKENIGLIEVMGLAILPARLKNEMSRLAELIESGRADEIGGDPICGKHEEWYRSFRAKYEGSGISADKMLREEIGATFVKVLEDSGVYKTGVEGRVAFSRFIDYYISMINH